jgi:hypothetical protein
MARARAAGPGTGNGPENAAAPGARGQQHRDANTGAKASVNSDQDRAPGHEHTALARAPSLSMSRRIGPLNRTLG